MACIARVNGCLALRNVFMRKKHAWDFPEGDSREGMPMSKQNNEIYLLGDFNINLFQNGKYLIGEKKTGFKVSEYP